jgi:hypothetical protein
MGKVVGGAFVAILVVATIPAYASTPERQAAGGPPARAATTRSSFETRMGPSVDVIRDPQSVTVALRASAHGDFSDHLPELRRLGLKGVSDIDLIFPISACRFAKPLTFVTTCAVPRSEPTGQKVAIRFNLERAGGRTKAVTTDSSSATEVLKLITTSGVDGERTYAWRLQITLDRVCVGAKKSGPIGIDLGGEMQSSFEMQSALEPPVPLDRPEPAVGARFHRQTRAGLLVDFVRDQKNLTVSLRTSGDKDLATFIPILRTFGFTTVSGIDLILPISGCHFGRPDAELHVCSAPKAGVRFIADGGTRIVTAEAPSANDLLTAVTTVEVSPGGDTVTSKAWRLRITSGMIRAGANVGAMIAYLDGDGS